AALQRPWCARGCSGGAGGRACRQRLRWRGVAPGGASGAVTGTEGCGSWKDALPVRCCRSCQRGLVQGRAERPVSLRLGEEVQEVPRRNRIAAATVAVKRWGS